MTRTCPCCGQTIKAAVKPKGRWPARTFRSFDDYQPALIAAQKSVVAALGLRWKLIRGASVYARLPRAWVAVKTAHCSLPGRRDTRLPAAQFWPNGALPVGPEYTPEYAWEAPLDNSSKFAELKARHANILRFVREGSFGVPAGMVGKVKGLEECARLRREFAALCQIERIAA